jgi:hypothetical protein
MTYDDVVKSFEVSSVSFVSSGNSLNIKAERRVAKTKTLATLLLNWTVIPDTKRQQPVTSRLKSKHLVDTMSCQTPMIVYDVPRVVAVTKILRSSGMVVLYTPDTGSAPHVGVLVDELAGLPPADGIVFADAHPGNPVNVLRGFNPSVIDEANPPSPRVNAPLDPFDRKNGFDPSGNSHYSADFQKRYYAAQSKRMNALIDAALAKLEQMKRGDYAYPDDDIIVIPRGGNPGAGPGAAAALFNYDADIPEIFGTARPEKLLRNDGSIVTQVVTSVYVAEPRLAALHRTFDAGTKILSIRSFLSANAVRSTNSLDGIDDCSSNNSTVCAVRSIRVPELFVAMGAHYFVRDTEREYDAATTADKDMIVIEGATHGFTPCTRCETTPDQYANLVKNFFDYVRGWIDKRY